MADSDGKTSSPQTDSEYLVKASGFLRRLSGGFFRQMSWRGNATQLGFTDRRGRRLDARELRPAHFANVYFSLWLTRLEQYADRGIRYPVVVDDPLRVTASNRKRRVARMLREFAAIGHQILLVTRDRQHAQVFGQLGVPIADLSDREHPPATRGIQEVPAGHEPASP